MSLIQDLINDVKNPAEAFAEIAGSLDRHSLAQHVVDLTTAVQGALSRIEALEKAWGPDTSTPAPAAPAAAPAAESTSPSA